MKTIIIFFVLCTLTMSCNNENLEGKANVPLNTAVFTTKNVIRNGYLITRVYHDNDNSWQFFDDISTNSNENIMIVGLGEILKYDATVAGILDTPIGYYATRRSKEDKWVKLKLEQEKE